MLDWQRSSSRLTEYGSENVITQPFTGTNDRMIAFCAAFSDLRKTLDSRLTLSTALVLSRTTVTIDAISTYTLLQTTRHLLTICVQDAINYCQLSNQWKCRSIIAKRAFPTHDRTSSRSLPTGLQMNRVITRAFCGFMVWLGRGKVHSRPQSHG